MAVVPDDSCNIKFPAAECAAPAKWVSCVTGRGSSKTAQCSAEELASVRNLDAACGQCCNEAR